MSALISPIIAIVIRPKANTGPPGKIAISPPPPGRRAPKAIAGPPPIAPPPGVGPVAAVRAANHVAFFYTGGRRIGRLGQRRIEAARRHGWGGTCGEAQGAKSNAYG